MKSLGRGVVSELGGWVIATYMYAWTYFPLDMSVATVFVRNGRSRTKTCQTVSSGLDEMGTSSQVIAAIELEGCCDTKHGM